jgi:hypothetical protein
LKLEQIEEGCGMLEMSDESENPPFYEATQHTFTISNTVSLKIFSNNNPRNMKIAALQKGLILVCNGTDVIGEGTGFGVPIAKYSSGTVFSGSSFLYIRRRGNIVEIRKEFLMDLVTSDRLRGLKIKVPRIRAIFDFFSTQYQKHKGIVRPVLIVRSLFLKFGVTSSFIKSPHKGTVIVNYIMDRNRIQVKLDFSQLEQINLEKVFVLNEQGAHFFSTYFDSEGLRLVDGEIGVWGNVSAQSAKILNGQNKIGFSLKNIGGSVLRRGRELMKGSLNWIGLDYELDPEYYNFEYEIELV